jgi:hypothetical protein
MIKNLILFVLFGLASHALEAKTYGAVMPKGKAIDVATVVSNAGDYDGKQGKLKGRITQVCQAKGCWLMIESNGKAARVMTNDAFFVPKNSKGEAVIFGAIKQVQMEEKMAKHLAKDAGSAETVASKEIHVIASSIAIK